MKLRLALLIGLLAAAVLHAAGPVYVVLWFDTEDYVEPKADDAALRIAQDLTSQGVRATFKVVGEKARVLEQRGRWDVVRALAMHEIGYHSNFHSIPPAPAVYLRDLGWIEGVAEFERREAPGVADVRRILGVLPICYGQPGSSWAPQANAALRHMGVPVYLDEGTHVGIDHQPFWYDGELYIFNMGPNSIRASLEPRQSIETSNAHFDQVAADLAAHGGGVISIYYHPTEFVTTEFWDAVNFSGGASRERSEWKHPQLRTPAEAERCLQVLHDYVAHMKAVPGVRFITARQALEVYGSPLPPKVDRTTIAAHMAAGQTFLRTDAGTLSAADMLLNLLGIDPQVVDGPATRIASNYGGETIPRVAFERTKADVVSFIHAHRRLPAEAWIASEKLSIGDFAATLAADGGAAAAVPVRRANLQFEQYISSDPQRPFSWPIHPPDFAAEELHELGRLQAWTLKPAQLR